MTIWTEEWPTEPGWYWFWGYPYGKKKSKHDLGDNEPRLNIVRVAKISNGVMYVREGSFWGPSKKVSGMFTKAILPTDYPELEIDKE